MGINEKKVQNKLTRQRKKENVEFRMRMLIRSRKREQAIIFFCSFKSVFHFVNFGKLVALSPLHEICKLFSKKK